MGSWSFLNAKRLVSAFTLGLTGFFVASCGNDKPGGVDGDPGPGGLATSDRCATPNVGCDCATTGKVVPCGTVQREEAGQVWCSVGHRTCGADGTWGECGAEDVKILPAPAGDRSPQGLGDPAKCVEKPCDPFCQQVTDSGADLQLPTGIQATGDGGITLVSKQGNLNDTECTGIRVVPDQATVTVTGIAGGSNGLRGEYFAERFFDAEGQVIPAPDSAVPAFQRIDSEVNFDWNPSPGAPLGVDDFTIRWSGWLKPQLSGDYQLCVVSDDGHSLELADRLLIHSWEDHPAAESCSEPVTLTANLRYSLRLDYYENYGEAAAKLRWKHAAAPAGEIIPNAVLLPPDAGSSSGLTVEPGETQFQAFAVPDGCFEGPLRAAWTVDRLDRSRVDGTGRLALLAPIAGDVKVTAYVGAFSASGVVHVNVDTVEAFDAPAGAVDAFEDQPAGADDLRIVYPYAETVFPLALRAPTVQWNSPTPADAVKVTVRYPYVGDPIFSWSKIFAEPAPGRLTIPQTVWESLGATAKGETAGIAVERVVAGNHLEGEVRPIVFADAPLRGKIYYTQYGRAGTTNIMVADPGSESAAKPVFETETNTGHQCPVCHSMSANGTMFATADRSFSSNGGLSLIDPQTGAFSPLGDYSADAKYRQTSDDWRGFAWAAISPDGALALAANNVWGNSREQVVGITQPTQTVVPTQAVVPPAGVVSGGSGTGLLAKYYMNTAASGWDWRRIDAKVDFNWGTGSPGGPVPVAFSTAWTGQVQAYTTETYTLRVTTTGGVRLVVNAVTVIDDLAHSSAAAETLTGTVALTRGVKVPISLEFRDNGGNARVSLAWSSATIAPGVIPQTQLYHNDGLHGVVATYYRTTSFTDPFITDRLEANVDASWGGSGPRPMASGDDDAWSASYRGRLHVPVSGNLSVCATADDNATISVDGVERVVAAGASYACSSAFAVAEGELHDFEARFVEQTGSAQLRLFWRIQNGAIDTLPAEIIPTARLLPPASFAAPSRGLSVTYYDDDQFNDAVSASAGTLATQRIEPSIDLNWASSRPEHSSALTNNDYFSARFTGRLEAPCEGFYDFEVVGNDGGRVYIDGERVVQLWRNGTRQGTKWLAAGMHDIKVDHHDLTGAARLSLAWKPHCSGAVTYSVIPAANLHPTGDAGTNGYVLQGGDNPSDTSYFVWQLPTSSATAPVDVSNEDPARPDRWGLGGATLMVPSFSPDSSKLVFIDGDSGAGNGWRKGVSIFDFDRTAKLFTNRRTIVSTFPFGDVMKWPVFESDSRSVIYQATVPADRCCFNDWTKYGYMGPTNYFEDPGRLLSVDSEGGSPAAIELKRLNDGERPEDRNKAYQASMLPQAAAGYRWAVFTSTRPYGNTLNLSGQQDFSNPASYTRMTETGKIQSMLWVSAIDDEVSGDVDRSHPAFFLPNQSFSEDSARGFINERAYWVKEACRPSGSGAEASCDVDEDCCGAAEGLAVCRIDTPLVNPPTRHCFRLPVGDDCVATGAACATSEECCGGGTNVCDDGICTRPPSLGRYAPANYARIYEANCGPGKQVQWTAFEYKASVPAEGGALEFYAESADDAEDFHALPVSPTAVNDSLGIVHLGTEGPPGDLSKWTAIPVSARLEEEEVVHRQFLKVTIRFVPNRERLAAPVLTHWRQTFSCPPAE